MEKTKSEPKNRNERIAKYQNQIVKIRDWLGFFFTAVGFFLSLSGAFHINIQVQCNIVIEIHSNSSDEEKTEWNIEDFYLDLKKNTYNLRTNTADKQKKPIEWAYIDATELSLDTLKKKKRSLTQKCK